MAYENYKNEGPCVGKCLYQLSKIGVPLHVVETLQFHSNGAVTYGADDFATIDWRGNTPKFTFVERYKCYQELNDRALDKWAREDKFQQQVLALWQRSGGTIHGPNVEMVTIPEQQFYKFLQNYVGELLYKQWDETYRAASGAFDTPAERLHNDNEYAADARKRMRELDSRMRELCGMSPSFEAQFETLHNDHP